MIEVESLSKTYTVHRKRPGLLGSLRALFRRERLERQAVRDVSFRVGEGEIVGIVGANGAGKTTLVKMLAGIIRPTAGRARVLGHDPWRRDDAFRARIALIMGQKAQLWWDLPAADCFLLLKEIYRIPGPEYRARLDELADVLGVRDLLEIQIRRLSLGERMKLELIAALLHNPRVVYLDEPTIGLDLTAQRAIRDFILDYRERYQPAMLLTSHYMEDIERLCRRILIIREGELVYDGSLAHVRERFAPYRVVTAHLRREGRPARPPERLLRLGEILDGDAEGGELRVRVPRGDVAAAATCILDAYPVADLQIEEMPIGAIIEGIMRVRGTDGDAP